jgi:DNA end-binding protein Ku
MRAIANLTLSFGLVTIPVKLYSATESSATVRLRLMAPSGQRVRQQYVADPKLPEPEFEQEVDASSPSAATPGREWTSGEDKPPKQRHSLVPAPVDVQHEPPQVGSDRHLPTEPEVIERQTMVKGYEFEQGQFVLFTPAELKALEAASRDSVDIVAFIPVGTVDPVYYHKAYLLAPGLRGEKTYSLLLAALLRSGRSALAKWAWKGKEYVVEIRPADGGLVLQQLFYADEVRSPANLVDKLVDVSPAELELAVRLVEQGAKERYDPTQFVDEEKRRLLEAIEKKIAGREIVSTSTQARPRPSGQVIDLMAALRASLHQPPPGLGPGKVVATKPATGTKERKPARRGSVPPEMVPTKRKAGS